MIWIIEGKGNGGEVGYGYQKRRYVLICMYMNTIHTIHAAVPIREFL